MSRPMKTSSYVSPVWFRADLPRETADQYWSGPHAEIAGRLPNMEYVQHHFSPTDHGYWPSSPTVGTTVPPDWRCDGIAEVRFFSTAAALAVPLHMREVYLDEQNVFERVLGQVTGPGGGRWWNEAHDDSVAHRTVLLLRRRRGVSGRTFRRFVHDRIGPALCDAGALDLRTYTFLPWMRLLHSTIGVAHDNPVIRRYHGCVIVGADSRAAMDDLLKSEQVEGIVSEQHAALTAVHAFAVDRAVPVVRVRGSKLSSAS